MTKLRGFFIIFCGLLVLTACSPDLSYDDTPETATHQPESSSAYVELSSPTENVVFKVGDSSELRTIPLHGVCSGEVFGIVSAGTLTVSCVKGVLSGTWVIPVATSGELTIKLMVDGYEFNRAVIIEGCPENFVLVPANSAMGTTSFCVAKYEMKAAHLNGVAIDDGNNGNVALDVNTTRAQSRPDGTPWTRITHAQAIDKCQEMGSGYSFITLQQWNALARHIESVGANWTGGSVGVGMLYRGHTDGVVDVNAVSGGYSYSSLATLAAPDDDELGYMGTGNNSSQAAGAGREQRRTHFLPNGEVVWDLSGNARERVDADGLGGTISYTGPGSSGYQTFTSAALLAAISTMVTTNGVFIPAEWIQPALPYSTYENGAGQFYLNSGLRSGKVITRGGNFAANNHRGIFGGDIDNDSSTSSSSGGFRCVYVSP
ncbi:MAG: hypothetical protein AAGB31_14070 [Bdellovibrio sp.]